MSLREHVVRRNKVGNAGVSPEDVQVGREGTDDGGGGSNRECLVREFLCERTREAQLN